MAKKLDSLTSLTEFGPLSPKAETKTSFLRSLFKKSRDGSRLGKSNITSTVINDDSVRRDRVSSTLHSSNTNFNDTSFETRDMAGVLKMVRSMVDKKKVGLQNYKDSDFKQYWMPDSNCKECYECGDKFTTFRRRHHCRVCGQIFCWRCCNQGISGNLMGYSGDLRVCTYCHKMVSTCMQSFDGSEVSEDLMLYHDNTRSSLSSQHQPEWSTVQQNNSARRRSSVMGFREEEIAKAKNSKSNLEDFRGDMNYASDMNLKKSSSVFDYVCLSNLFKKFLMSEEKFSSHKQCFLHTQFIQGYDIVEWLTRYNPELSSSDARSIGQSFLDAHFIEPENPEQSKAFNLDVTYNLKEISGVHPKLQHMDSTSENQESMDPLWVKEIQSTESCITRESSLSLDGNDFTTNTAVDTCDFESRSRIPSSSSSFYLDLDIKESTVRVSRPLCQVDSDSLNASITSDNNLIGTIEKTENEDNDAYGMQNLFAETFLKAFGANLLTKSGSRSSQDSHTIQQLKEENEKRIVFEKLSSSYCSLEGNLLRQLLEKNMLSCSWIEIILPILHSVIETVHPDVKNDTLCENSMDIRQYVQFKKIPGGTKLECDIVHGVVFTKSVAHRKMEQNIAKPSILLLSSPITYQRTENKLSSLDPLIMQEFEYLKNTIGKLTVCKPDVLLVEKSVSRVAQEMLLSFGITVALNVKPTVMDRIARCTKAAVLSTVDAHLGKPKLGTCKEFKVKTYSISLGKTKTLMFLDGCPTQLGCTILLRGGSAVELKKVKAIVQYMLYVAYNWKLERSFLMDEFALPPPDVVRDSIDLPENEENLNCNSENNTGEIQIGRENDFEPINDIKEKVRNKGDDINHRLAAKCIDDFSDPLHSYLQSESDILLTDSSTFEVNSLPVVNTFRKLLDDIILCCSLYVDVNLPYLETEAGKQCPLRKFFPNEIFWSAHFQKEKESTILHSMQVNFEDDNEAYEIPVCNTNIEIEPPHSFITYKFIDKSFCRTSDIFSLLADYRAQGCSMKSLCLHQILLKERDKKNLAKSGYYCKEILHKNKQHENAGTSLLCERKVDVLDPFNHQKLEVLFCSYSCASNNAPNYCVNPWVVKMDFYGTNDIPVGGFLEKYCFRSTYVCPSQSCDTPMTGHVRKFVHDIGCVRIVLLEYSSGIQTGDKILMWSWCPICKQASSVVPMSEDTYAFSFAKYLELKFYANSYLRQGTNGMCSHSLHHCHNQYFAHKQMVAIFEYNPITVWEIFLPSLTIPIHDEAMTASSVVDQIKNIAVKGFEIYSIVLEKLFAFEQQYIASSCEDAINIMISQQKAEMSAFREKIEQIQLRLTSPTLESMRMCVFEIPEKHKNRDICNFMWKVEDQVTLLKYHVAEAVQLWNTRIQDFILNARKKEEKATKPLLLTKTSENDDITSSECMPTNSPGKDIGQFEARTAFNVSLQVRNSVKELKKKNSSSVHYLKSFTNMPSKNSTAVNTSLFKKQKSRSLSKWMERALSFESIPEHMTIHTKSQQMFRSFSAPANLAYDLDDAYIIQTQHEKARENEDDKNSISSSDSSYTYGAAPGIYAGLMVPEPEESESYVVCHKEKHETKYSNFESSRGHERSKSEGHQMGSDFFSKSSVEKDDNSKCEKKERTVKTLLSQLLSSSEVTPIQQPFPPTQHIIKPRNENERELMIPVIVYDNEPSSIIAYTLASAEYEQKLQEVRVNVSTAHNSSQKDSQTSSPMPKRRQNTKSSDSSGAAAETLFLQNSDSADFLDLGASNNHETDKNAIKLSSKISSFHVEVQFNDISAKFYCRVYYAEQFRKLRCLVFNEGEERYIRSLSHCVAWMARGGKSGSTFCKTQDDRFILKQMQKLELQSFLEFAPAYFQYINKACLDQKPTLLAKIVGVYRIGYKNSVTNSASKMDVLVIENLFYGRSITRKYDLKGSVRNRLVNTSGIHEDDVVLLDENLLKITCDNPLYIRPHSKTILSVAIENDTQFLADQSVMDYSLLVGMDDEKRELIVGIIDYIRTFTWDKKVEMLVKSSGILGGHGKMPTVVSPELYRMRFREAMDGYFLWVPDRWTNLGNLGKDMPMC